jgi:uncharacterized protein YbaP (TraB family)
MKSLRNCYSLPLWFGVALVSLALSSNRAHSATNAQHSLWKVEGKRSTVYLAGSIHVLKAENYPLPPEFDKAYTNAAILAFETDMGAMEQMDTQMKLLSKAKLPDGDSLATQLSAATYAKFTNHLNSAGLPAMVFDQFKPSMAALTLQVLELQKLGFDPAYGLDKHFYDLGRKDGKTIEPLETIEFQMGLVTDFTKEEGELFMKITLEDIEKTKQEMGDMIKAWQNGNSDGLEKMLNDATQKAPALFKRLLTDRNHRWLPKIQEWVQGDKSVLLVVGAGHLVGKEGVVELLRKQGLKVTQQ